MEQGIKIHQKLWDKEINNKLANDFIVEAVIIKNINTLKTLNTFGS